MPTKGKKGKKGTKKKKVVKVVFPVAKRKGKKKKQTAGLVVTRRVSAPVAKAASLRQKGPNINGGKYFRVRHRELITSIGTIGGAWNTFRYQCQPGVGTVFPWLSQVAQSFKEYRFRRLTFHFEPNCATTREGALVLVPLYDPSNSTPTSVEQALDCKNAVSFPVWQRGSSSFSGQKFMKNLFVRTMDLPTGSEESLKFYDSGAMVLALDGVAAGTNIGKFTVDYEVDFFIPYKTSGSSFGFGYSAKQELGTGELECTDCFAQIKVDQTVDGKLVRWVPPGSESWVALGNSDVSPDYNGVSTANKIKFAIPGWYVVMFRYDVPGVPSFNPTMSGIIVSGCTGTLYRTNVAAVIGGEAFVNAMLIWSQAVDATVECVFDFSLAETQNTVVSVFTVNNAIFTEMGETGVGLSSHVVMDVRTQRLLRKNRYLPEYFENKFVHVLDEVGIDSYRKTGKIPKVSSDVLKRYRALKVEVDALTALACVSDDEKDIELTEVPLDPSPRVEVKQSREPSAAPVAKAASSGIGSYVGAVLGRKPNDK